MSEVGLVIFSLRSRLLLREPSIKGRLPWIFFTLVCAAVVFLIQGPNEVFADNLFLESGATAALGQGGQTYSRQMADSVSVASYFDSPSSRSFTSRTFARGISDGVSVASEFGGPASQTTASQARTLGPQQPASQRVDSSQRLLLGNNKMDGRQYGTGTITQSGTPIAELLMTDADELDFSELATHGDGENPDSHQLLQTAMAASYSSTSMQGMVVYSSGVNGVYVVAIVVVALLRTRRFTAVKIKLGGGTALVLPLENSRDVRGVIFITVAVAAAAISATPPQIGQAFADSMAGAVYKEGTSGAVSYREWDGSTWGGEVVLPDPGTSDILSVKFGYSPVSQLRVATALDSNGFLWLYYCSTSCNNGANWALVDADAGTGGTQALVDIGTATAGRTYHDIAFEGLSGTLLIVYDKTVTENADIYFRTFDDTALSAESSYDHDAASDEEIFSYFRLASKPGSDEIVLITLDDSADDVFAFIWNGSTFGSKLTLTTSTGFTSDDTESIGVAYETNTGAAVVFSGDGADSAAYARWSGSWSAVSTTDPNTTNNNDVRYVTAKSDPSTDAIMICQEDDLSDLSCSEFTSGSPATWTILESNTASTTSRPADFAWDPTGNTGLALYYESAATDLKYRTFSGTSFSGETTVTTGLIKWIVGATDSESTNNGVDSLWLMYVDAITDTIGDAKWDGTTFTNNGETTFSADAGTTNTIEVMALSFKPARKSEISDALAVTDSISITTILTKPASDTVTVAEAVARVLTTQRSIADSISVAAMAGINKGLPDSISTTDQITTAYIPSRSISDASGVSDNIGRIYRPLASSSDSVLVTDSASSALVKPRYAADSITVADAVTRETVFLRSASDSVAVTDAAARNIVITRSLSDNAAVTDLPARTIVVAVATQDSVPITDSIARTVVYPRTNAETVTVIDSIARTIAIVSPISDDISIGDAAARTRLTFRSLADSVSVSDAIVHTTTYARSISDTITAMDSTIGIVPLVREVADTLSVTDAISATMTVSRSKTDNLSVSDSIARAVSFGQTIEESLSVADSAASMMVFTKSTADTLTLVDVIATSEAYVKDVADTITLIDAVSRTVSFARAVADSIATSEMVERIYRPSKSVSDSIVVADSASPKVVYYRSVSDALAITDSMAKSVAFAKLISDTVTITETPMTTFAASRSLADTLAVNEEIVRGAAMTRSISDTVTTIDSVASIVSFTRAIADSLAVTDLAAPHTSLARSISDFVVVTDIIGRMYGSSRSLADALSATDLAAHAVAIVKSVAETVNIEDSIANSEAYTNSIADSVAAADAIARAVAFSRFISDSVTLTELVATNYFTTKPASDSLTVADAMSMAVALKRSLSDPLALTDLIAAKASASRSATETLAATDAVSRTVSFARTIAEPVAITEELATNATSSRLVTDSLTVADDIVVTVSATRLAADALAVTDIAKRAIFASRQISDGLAVTDMVSAKIGARTVFDAVTVTDAIAARITARAISDSLTVTDIITATITAVSISDALTATDLVSAKVIARSASDELAIADTVTAKIGNRSIADSVTVADSISALVTGRSASDAVTVADAVKATVNFRLADSVTVADAAARAYTTSRPVSEPLSVADLVSPSLVYARSMSDALAVTDSVAGSLTFARAIADSLAVADQARSGSVTLNISDALAITDEAQPTSHSVNIVEPLTITDDARGFEPPHTEDLVIMTDAISTHVNRLLADAVSVSDTVGFVAGDQFAAFVADSLAIADTITGISGKMIRIDDPLTLDATLTNVSVHWNRNFGEEFVLGECTPFACNLVWHGYEVLGLTVEITPQPTPADILTVADSIERELKGSSVPNPSDAVSFSESVTARILSILVVSNTESAGPLPSTPIPGNFTYTGNAASLKAQIQAMPIPINSTVAQPDLSKYVTILRTFHVQITPNAVIPGDDVIVTETHKEVPAQSNMFMRLNFKETPQLNEHNFIQTLDIAFTPRVNSTNFGLVVGVLDAPPDIAPLPPEELRPIYVDIRWVGNFPGSESPAVPTYYQNSPRFTFTVNEEWVRDQGASRDAKGIPNLKLWLLDESANQWTQITSISKPTAERDGTYAFIATLPHFSGYAITATKASVPSGVTVSTARVVNLLESLAVGDVQETLAVEMIDDYVEKKLAVGIADAIAIFTKPVSYKTFQVGGVEVRITAQDVRQESIITTKATATFLVEMDNLGGKDERFTLNFWYYDQSGNRPYESSQVAEIGPHESRQLLVDVPFTEPGVFEVTAEARSIPDGNLINTGQLTVTIPWLAINLYIVVVVAVAVLGASAGVMAVLLRGGLGSAGAGTALFLLTKKRKPSIRVTDTPAAAIEGEEYDIVMKVRQRESLGAQAVFDLEIVNRSKRTHEFTLKYWASDSSGIRMSEHVERVRIKGRTTEVKAAQVVLPPGRNIFVAEAGLAGEKRARWSHAEVRVKKD